MQNFKIESNFTRSIARILKLLFCEIIVEIHVEFMSLDADHEKN